LEDNQNTIIFEDMIILALF